MKALVLGDGRPYCVALLLPGNGEISEKDISLAVDEVNRGLPDYAKVEAWVRLRQPMSAEDGLLTENGRPRRDKIVEYFSCQIDQLYYDQAETIAL